MNKTIGDELRLSHDGVSLGVNRDVSTAILPVFIRR